MTRRVVIVTGGTFGIGRAITAGLATRGHAIVAFGLEAPQVSSTAAAAISGLRAELAGHGHDALVLEADVSRSDDVARVVDETLRRYGRVDALVNNAAIGPLGTVLDTDPHVVMQADSSSYLKPALALLEEVTYVELSDRPDFNDAFVEQLSFHS